MTRGYMYILECANGQYYTGSTKDLDKRLEQHNDGLGANFTKKHLPVKLLYHEEFQRIDEAFYREKQVQGWSRKKKEALISGTVDQLHQFAECRNESHCKHVPFDSAQGSGNGSADVPFDSAQGTAVVERSRTVVERSRTVVERSRKVVERSRKVVERSRKVVERSRKVVERSRNHTQNKT